MKKCCLNFPAIWMAVQSLTCGQELDLLIQLDDQIVKPGVDSLMKIHTLQTYCGIKFIKRPLIALSLAIRTGRPEL